MRVARRTFLASTLASVAAPAVVRSGFADTPQYVLKLHHAFSAVSSVHDKFLAPWARQVESQSGGRIRIDLFPSMQLGGPPSQLFDQARDGIADIVWTAPSLNPGRFPKIEAFELPFVPSRRALVSSKAIDDFGRANLADEFREVQPLCYSCADRGVIHTTRSVHTFEDMKGLRLHVQTRLGGEALRTLGALPVPMPNAELPLAITQHVVDGCVDPWDMVPTLRLNDLLKAHTDFSGSSLSTMTFAMVMNKPAYDRLPHDLKTVIDANSGQVAAGMAGTMWDLQAAAVVDMVAERGDVITTLLPEAEAHWRKITEPVVEAWLKDMKERKVDGGKLLAATRALLAKYVNEPEPKPPQPPQPEQVSEPAQPQAPPRQAVEAKAEPAKIDSPTAKPSSSPAPAAKPAPSASAAPPAKPETSWWRWFWQSKPAASPIKPVPAAASAAPVPTPAPPVAVTPPPPAAPAVTPTPATASAAPVAPPAPVAAPSLPAAAAVPTAPLSPPKALDIPL